jgi:8-oxo-dGTP pyrophosphatase MutT (NUDIX family)
MEKNWCYKITDPNHPKCGTTLWSGRYCAVTGIVFAEIDNDHGTKDVYVLANLRGPGTPDFQGYWNMPCGFLERNESGEQGVCREMYEECGFSLKPEDMLLYGVETDPATCNNGNVTIRYYSYKHYSELPKLNYKNINGEEGEVDSVKWINVEDVKNYKWAFGHDKLISKCLFSKTGRYIGEVITTIV